MIVEKKTRAREREGSALKVKVKNSKRKKDFAPSTPKTQKARERELLI
jgi:hypothetical protein